jgi:hypothetical protein
MADTRCLLCHKAQADAVRGRAAARGKPLDGGRLLGPLTVGSARDAWVHEWCCIFAPCAKFLRQYDPGPDSSPLQPADIDCVALQREVKRASRLRCALCKKPGAVVGCYICSQKCYHYPCAVSD